MDPTQEWSEKSRVWETQTKSWVLKPANEVFPGVLQGEKKEGGGNEEATAKSLSTKGNPKAVVW